MIEINGYELAMLVAAMNPRNPEKRLSAEGIREAWDLWVDCDAFLEGKVKLEAEFENNGDE